MNYSTSASYQVLLLVAESPNLRNLVLKKQHAAQVDSSHGTAGSNESRRACQISSVNRVKHAPPPHEEGAEISKAKAFFRRGEMENQCPCCIMPVPYRVPVRCLFFCTAPRHHLSLYLRDWSCCCSWGGERTEQRTQSTQRNATHL